MTREEANKIVKLMHEIQDVEFAMEAVEANDVLAETGYTQMLLDVLIDKRADLLRKLEEL